MENYSHRWVCMYTHIYIHIFVCIRSVAQSCPTLCDPMNCSTPGLPVHHQLPEFTETHVHRVSDAIQPSHPLSSWSPSEWTGWISLQSKGLSRVGQHFGPAGHWCSGNRRNYCWIGRNDHVQYEGGVGLGCQPTIPTGGLLHSLYDHWHNDRIHMPRSSMVDFGKLSLYECWANHILRSACCHA